MRMRTGSTGRRLRDGSGRFEKGKGLTPIHTDDIDPERLLIHLGWQGVAGAAKSG
jgi:hypothetical protein